MIALSTTFAPPRISFPAHLYDWIAREQGRFLLWAPVFMGSGTLLYFGLRSEPPWWVGGGLALLCFGAALLTRPWMVIRAAFRAGALVGLGFAAAQFAAARALPIEPLPTKAVIVTGTVRAVELLPAGRRIAIDHVRLENGAALARWLRIKLKPLDKAAIETGDVVQIRARMLPPAPPAFPGGWDLQREAFFSGLAGYGYALGPVQPVARSAPTGIWREIQWLRDTICARIAKVLPGPAGAVSATLLTGVTSAIPESDRAAFRDSGLAHLLAVAGLHIGIVMGLILGLVRGGLACSERACLSWPSKQIAALAALAAGGGYMLLTGMHLPIVRSFTMAALFTLAMLTGRRAVSLRGLALAGVVLLLTEPWEITGVSFQMSFSAVLALIVGYELLRPALHRLHGDRSLPRRFLHHVAGLALTSALAGTASAPFAAYHFGYMQVYNVAANMIAVPLAAMWVMPTGLAALALMPFGWERLALVPMGWGVEGILWVARTTSALPAATLPVPHIPGWGLGLLALGMACAGLWRSRLRLAGLALIAAGLLSPVISRGPDILVSADARLIGMRAPGAIYLQEASGVSKFTREEWENFWGTQHVLRLPPEHGALDAGITCMEGGCRLQPRPGAQAAILVRHDFDPALCNGAALLLSAEPAGQKCPGAAVIDRFTVWREGAQAVWLGRDGAMIVSDKGERGARPWVLTPASLRKQPSLRPAQTETVPES
ncbi:MAG: ComEC/Rec2 family competence protein [Acetobacteraceae bacterium]|nr:ComEC/Rec2 family competence protein [Acetobacteraceae bacterium]